MEGDATSMLVDCASSRGVWARLWMNEKEPALKRFGHNAHSRRISMSATVSVHTGRLRSARSCEIVRDRVDRAGSCWIVHRSTEKSRPDERCNDRTEHRRGG
eukprot:6604669-Prymnesium_polylepis.1